MHTEITATERRRLIKQGKPVPMLGLTFYPITMLDYEMFKQLSDKLAMRMATLPVRYLSMDYISALFAMDYEALEKDGKPVGLYFSCYALLCMALQIDYTNKAMYEKTTYNKGANGEYLLNKIVVIQGGNTVEITPLQFSTQIRTLIAEQNGIALPDETENLDLVRANEEKRALEAAKLNKDLNISTADLIASVAYQSKVRESEVYGWAVAEFERRKAAIDRDKSYTLNGQAELTGIVKFPKGNPAPSWCYDRKGTELGTVGLGDVGKALTGTAQAKT